MPNVPQYGGQDWAPQHLPAKKNPNAGKGLSIIPPTTNKNVAAVEAQKREHLQLNKQRDGPGAQAKRLEEDTENLKVKRVPVSVAKNIMKARQKKEWTQAELAKAINEKPSVVTEYEQGKAIPAENVLQRMEKALGFHLRGVKAGEPLEQKKPKSPPPKK